MSRRARKPYELALADGRRVVVLARSVKGALDCAEQDHGLAVDRTLGRLAATPVDADRKAEAINRREARS